MAEYTVAKGDTLTKIAAQKNTTVADLAKLNNIADVNKINVGQKLNLSLPANAGGSLSTNNLKPTTNINVTQPQIATGSTTLTSDIISKGQADTARAVAEEARVAQKQGTSTESVLKNILSQSTGATPTVDNTMSTTNVGGITADTLSSQRQGIQDTLANIQGETNLTNQEYASTVDPAKVELNAINAQLNDEALAGRRRTEAVLNIPGITKEQAQDKINEISRVNSSKLADLAVVQMAKQGQYDSAKEIADRSVQAKVEDQKNKLNALMFTYTENKDLFTKAEQRAFETAQADRERKLNAEEKNLQRISDLSLQALADGAPASVVAKMRNSKTEAEAIALGGSYIGSLDRKVKLANIAQSNAATASSNRANRNTTTVVDTSGNVVLNRDDSMKLNKELVNSDAYKAIMKGKDSLNQVIALETKLKKYGSTSAVFDPIKNADLKSQYNQTTLNLKEFFNLGVLNGPDLTQIQGIVSNPSNVSNFRKTIQLGTYQPATNTQAGINNVKQMVSTTLDDRYKTLMGSYGSYSPQSLGSLNEVNTAYIEQKIQLDPKVKQLIVENPNLTQQDIINIILQ